MHKYGFHVNRTGDDVLDAIKRIKPAVIKTLDPNPGFWRTVRDVHPDAFLIGRLYVPNNEQAAFVDDPSGKGRAFAERVLALEANSASHRGRPLFDAWESYNEVFPESVDSAHKRAYDDFQVAFAAPIQAAGMDPIAMNFATGNMLGKDFLEHFPGTLETYRYLGFHEYDWPTMWRLHEENIRTKDEGGMWLTLRYRRAMQDVRRVYGDRHTVLITECGMTQGVQGGDDVGPWHESHPISEQSYWDSLMWYNGELMRDDYVLGACLFVVGAVTPWHSFEHLGGIVDRLERLQRGDAPAVLSRPSLPAAPSPAPGDAEPRVEPKPAREPERDTTPPREPTPGADAGATGHGAGAAGRTLAARLVEEAARRQVIRFNPDAALQKRIFDDGFVPNSEEFELERDGAQYHAQQAEHLRSGERRVYFVAQGDWSNVRFVRADSA